MENAKLKKYIFIFLLFFGTAAALSFDTLEIDEMCLNASNGDTLVRTAGVWGCGSGSGISGTNGTQNYFAFWTTNNTLGKQYLFYNASSGFLEFTDTDQNTGFYTKGLSEMSDINPRLNNTFALGTQMFIYSSVYAKYFHDGTNLIEVAKICTSLNGLCNGSVATTNNITGSFKANFLPKGLNQTALISSTIQENTTAVKIGSNLDLGAYNMSTQGGTWYENVTAWFGSSCVYPGFFGFESFNGSNRCNINDYLGGFYTPTNLDKRFYFGYGGDKTGGIFCSDSGKECAVAFSVNSTGSQVQFLRGGLTVNTVIQIGMRNARDFSIFVNETTGTAGGGNFNIGARMGGTIYQNQVHIIKVDNSTQALNVSGELFAKNLTTTGSVFVGSLNAIGSGQVLCLLANKTIGTCTSVVGVTGACTCV